MCYRTIKESWPRGSGFGLSLEGDVLLLSGIIKYEIRISKSEANPKFECSNPLNNQESIQCIMVNLFGALEFWSRAAQALPQRQRLRGVCACVLEFVSYFVLLIFFINLFRQNHLFLTTPKGHGFQDLNKGTR